jgi:hypothetical protein
MAPISNLPGSVIVDRQYSYPPCPADSHMTERGCSGFEESWPWTYDPSTTLQPETGFQPEGTETEWHDPSTSTQSEPEPVWHDPSQDDAGGPWVGSTPIKVESDYKLAGVPLFVWVMLFTAIVAAACVAFFFFA